MKIYFEDGKLEEEKLLSFKPDYTIDAGFGFSANVKFLDVLSQDNTDYIIYTNSILAFDNRYAWNEELQAPEIYIRAGNDKLFTRIDELTERELREGHNLAKMYITGEFEN